MMMTLIGIQLIRFRKLVANQPYEGFVRPNASMIRHVLRHIEFLVAHARVQYQYRWLSERLAHAIADCHLCHSFRARPRRAPPPPPANVSFPPPPNSSGIGAGFGFLTIGKREFQRYGERYGILKTGWRKRG